MQLNLFSLTFTLITTATSLCSVTLLGIHTCISANS